jgi:predicted phosphate transport protein (TIGR00153 family)
MAGKKDSKYFDACVEMVNHSCEAAEFLQKILNNYNPDAIKEDLEKMHEIEHAGDIKKHSMTKSLSKEFITPIEREDIMEMADAIDTVTDKIEDVALRLYMFNIREIREDAKTNAEVIVKCTNALRDALKEFHNFRKSKTIHDLVVEVNRLEEEADQLYIAAVRHLFKTVDNGMEAASWNQLFHYMEDVCDACEDASDVIESVIMKNS